MDIDTIRPGVDFVLALERAVLSCDVLLAVIGRNWLNVKGEDGKLRIARPEDFVRIEIGTALKNDIYVIPVLVGGARMPRSTELPPDLSALARRQAQELPDATFHPAVTKLIRAIEGAQEEQQLAREAEAKRKAEEEQQLAREAKRLKSEQEQTARRSTEAHADAKRRSTKKEQPTLQAELARASASQTGPDGTEKPSAENQPRNLKLSEWAGFHKAWNRLVVFKFWWLGSIAGWSAVVVVALLFYQSLTAPPGTVQVPPAPAAPESSTTRPGTAQVPSLPVAKSRSQTQGNVDLQPERPHEDNPDAAVQVSITAQENQRVWVSARVDGRFLYAVTLEPNESRTFKADKTVLLKLGNVGGANFLLNGKPVGPVGPKGLIGSVQFTSGGFRIVLPDASNSPAPKDLLDDPF